MTPDALDIIVAILLVLSGLMAWFRGLIKEVFTIVALFSASAASYFGGQLMIGPFERWLKVDKVAGEQAANAVSKAAAAGTDATIAKSNLFMGVASPEIVSKVAAYGSVFLFIYFVMSLIGFFLSRTVNESGLGILDKLGGAGFGFARGFLVVFLLYLPVSFMIEHESMPLWAKNSVTVPVLDKAVAFADTQFGLHDMIVDRGGELALRIGKKINPDEVGKDDIETAAGDVNVTQGNKFEPGPSQLQQELQQELTAEEKGIPHEPLP
jgi:membrane protein required for colicin V production